MTLTPVPDTNMYKKGPSEVYGEEANRSIAKALHWLKIPERIHFKVLTNNSLQYSQPQFLREVFTIQPPRSARSSAYLTLFRPSVTLLASNSPGDPHATLHLDYGTNFYP